MTESTHLSFTLGPVQGFVAQARRTRDLWAGSWLLSYLAESALAAAEEVGGETIIPHRANEDRGRVTTVQTVIGGVPNRFEMRFDSEEDAKRAGKEAEAGFRKALEHVARAVWGAYVEPVAEQGTGTEAIWQRQIKNFWECAWVVGTPDEGEKTIGRLAAARKAFRNVPAAPEAGVKCSLMGELQELSGFGPGEKQRQFWSELRGNLNAIHDLGETERLCAIALIKRLFPRIAFKTLSMRHGVDVTSDLWDQVGWPSTAFFAAQTWLKDEVASSEYEADAKTFFEAAHKAGIGQSERQAAQEAGLDSDWAGLDATAWFPNALQNNERDIDDEELKSLTQTLRKLHDDVGKTPVPYYSLLLMDGDSLGRLLDTLGEPQELSQCLGQFADKVACIVKSRGGRTIYAGGDDVLAMLPAKGALEVADELAQAYSQSFDGKVPEDVATLSGAIVYAHWKSPLRQVLGRAHHLLDDVAKEATGRNALAIGIVQGSGLSAAWSAPWSVVRGKETGAPDLQTMLKKFGADETHDKNVGFNASYLYHLREQFGRLLSDLREKPGRFAEFSKELADAARQHEKPDGLDLLGEIAHAEYRRRMSNGQRRDKQPSDTRPLISNLMALSHRWTRRLNYEGNNANESIESHTATFGFDGWRVARFLKQIQEGKVTGHE